MVSITSRRSSFPSDERSGFTRRHRWLNILLPHRRLVTRTPSDDPHVAGAWLLLVSASEPGGKPEQGGTDEAPKNARKRCAHCGRSAGPAREPGGTAGTGGVPRRNRRQW